MAEQVTRARFARFRRVQSPDGRRVAQIDPAIEISMAYLTMGTLCVSAGPHIEHCSPGFVWSDDSRYLAVPQFVGIRKRQRLIVIAFEEKRVYASIARAKCLEPESFREGQLVVTVNPSPLRGLTFGPPRRLSLAIPSELPTSFERAPIFWPAQPALGSPGQFPRA